MRLPGFLLLLAWCVALRAPTFVRSVVDWDESMYVLVAWQWLHGHIPYSSVFDHKPVGIYAIFAAAFALLGEAMLSVRLVTALFVYSTAVGLYFLAGRLGLARSSAILAAFSYPVFSLGLQGLSSNTEIFFIAFNVWGLVLALAALAREGRARYGLALLAGMCFGASLQTKYLVAFEIAYFAACLAVAHFRHPRRLAAFAAALGAGVALPNLAVLAYFAAHDALAQFYFANFEFNRRYAATGLAAERWEGFRHSTQDWIKWNWMTAAVIVAAMVAARRAPAERRPDRFLLGWLLVGFLEAWSPLKFFNHYFLVTIPPLCLLFAGRMGELLAHGRRRVFGALLAVALAFPLGRTIEKYYGPWLVEHVQRGDPNENVASEIRRRIAPGDAIYVVNGQPILYFLTGARLPSPYVQPMNLIDETFGRLLGIEQRAEVERILRQRPRAVVIRRLPQENRRVDEIAERVQAGYTLGAEIGDTLVYVR